MDVFSKKFKTTLLGLVVLLSAGVSLPAMAVEEVDRIIEVIGERISSFTKSYDGVNYGYTWQPGWWRDANGNFKHTGANETEKDRCSDEYKKHADNACRSDAGHGLMDENVMCRVRFGPPQQSLTMMNDPAILSALTKTAFKKGLKMADIFGEAWNLGKLISDNTRTKKHTNCQTEAKVEHSTKTSDCNSFRDEREHLCSLDE